MLTADDEAGTCLGVHFAAADKRLCGVDSAFGGRFHELNMHYGSLPVKHYGSEHGQKKDRPSAATILEDANVYSSALFFKSGFDLEKLRLECVIYVAITAQIRAICSATWQLGSH